MKITDFLVMDTSGSEISADPHGNNLAFCCTACGHPIVAVALHNQRGSDANHPATCRGCNAQYFLAIQQQANRLVVHRVAPNNSFKPTPLRGVGQAS